MSDSIPRLFLGSLIADAVAMPVHWYYDTVLLDRDYGEVDGYLAPKNPHAGSILWRSHYQARNELGEILHDQAQYWGQRGIHYHQFLEAGDNTVNYQLAMELVRQVLEKGHYDADAWLERYVDRMRTPGWHRDTYVEEYHRAFFDNLAQGNKARTCGIVDIHIGGLAHIPALFAALRVVGEEAAERIENMIREHVSLTHQGPAVDHAALALIRMLLEIEKGADVRSAIEKHGNGWIGKGKLTKLEKKEDRFIVGRKYTPACYLPESFTGSLALAWKYADDFEGGVLANARCGGDNCHRGAVVGSLLGAGNSIPEKWISGLKAREKLDSLLAIGRIEQS